MKNFYSIIIVLSFFFIVIAFSYNYPIFSGIKFISPTLSVFAFDGDSSGGDSGGFDSGPSSSGGDSGSGVFEPSSAGGDSSTDSQLSSSGGDSGTSNVGPSSSGGDNFFPIFSSSPDSGPSAPATTEGAPSPAPVPPPTETPTPPPTPSPEPTPSPTPTPTPTPSPAPEPEAVNTPSGGGGGGGGGGIGKPRVTLIAKADPQNLISLRLSQVPYTGIVLNNLQLIFFWAGLSLWSMFVAYIAVLLGIWNSIATSFVRGIRAFFIFIFSLLKITIKKIIRAAAWSIAQTAQTAYLINNSVRISAQTVRTKTYAAKIILRPKKETEKQIDETGIHITESGMRYITLVARVHKTPTIRILDRVMREAQKQSSEQAQTSLDKKDIQTLLSVI